MGLLAGKIVVETEEMGDDKETLQALMDKGKRAKIIVPDTVSSTDAANLKLLKKSWLGILVTAIPLRDILLVLALTFLSMAI